MSAWFYYCFSIIRWKLYKLTMRLSLGKVWGWGIDRNLVYFIPESCVSKNVLQHIDEVRRISDAYVQKYNFSNVCTVHSSQNKVQFCDSKAVSVRNLYLLSNVAVSAETGAVWIPNTCAFVESLGHNVHFYAWGGLIDLMRRPVRVSTGVITPCANLGYYHWLLDAMGQVLIARREMGDNVKVLVSSKSTRFLRDGLRYFGIKDEDLVWVDGPVIVDRAIMVARNNDLGVIFRDNVDVLRREIAKRCNRDVVPYRKIYISRRLESNRAIRNEDKVESIVRNAGFEVCYFEKTPFAEQIKIASEAKIIMGIHGAGLSNIIAGQDNIKVIELLNPAWYNTCFAQLAVQLGFEYHCAMLRQDDGGVYADISEIEKLICEKG